MRVSARNVLKGKLKKLVDGAVNSEVIIELPGGQEINSIITKQSAHNLGG
jgi:molybdopterin-binding protein